MNVDERKNICHKINLQFVIIFVRTLIFFTDDKKSGSADKKKKNIFDVLSTFSKKKGQKVKRQIITGDIPIDTKADISGKNTKNRIILNQKIIVSIFYLRIF